MDDLIKSTPEPEEVPITEGTEAEDGREPRQEQPSQEVTSNCRSYTALFYATHKNFPGELILKIFFYENDLHTFCVVVKAIKSAAGT